MGGRPNVGNGGSRVCPQTDRLPGVKTYSLEPLSSHYLQLGSPADTPLPHSDCGIFSSVSHTLKSATGGWARRMVNGWALGLWGQSQSWGWRGQGKVAVPSADNSAVPGNVHIGQGSSPGHSVGPVSFSAKRGQQPVSHFPSQLVLRLQTSREGSQSCRGRAKCWALDPWGGKPGKERGPLCPSAPSHCFSRTGRAQLCQTLSS